MPLKSSLPLQHLCGHAVRPVFPGIQGGPHDHINAAKAVSFSEALKPEFKNNARQIVKNAQALATALIEEGFTLVSGGTDTHLMLVNVMKSKGITGKQAELALEKA